MYQITCVCIYIYTHTKLICVSIMQVVLSVYKWETTWLICSGNFTSRVSPWWNPAKSILIGRWSMGNITPSSCMISSIHCRLIIIHGDSWWFVVIDGDYWNDSPVSSNMTGWKTINLHLLYLGDFPASHTWLPEWSPTVAPFPWYTEVHCVPCATYTVSLPELRL